MKTNAKGAYHHGDLANAALAAALRLLREEGTEAFTLAQLARRLGVSAAALYRHFPDREGLLAAVALESFRLFELALRGAQGPTPLERLHAMAVAYLGFAFQFPERYGLMFSARGGSSPRAVELAADQAFAALVDALRAAAPTLSAEAVTTRSKQVWAHCHGFATLALSGALELPQRQVRALTWEGISRLIAS